MQEDPIDGIVHQWERERPDLDVSPTHVLQRISRLYLLQSASFAAVFDSYGITFGEFEVLASLLRSGPPYQMSPTRLVDAVVLSSGAMTNRIDRLEALGFVERRPDRSDRRGTLVALTEEGEKTVDAAVVEHLANEERLLISLSPAEREALALLLRKLLLSQPFAELGSSRTVDHGTRTTRRRRGRARLAAPPSADIGDAR